MNADDAAKIARLDELNIWPAELRTELENRERRRLIRELFGDERDDVPHVGEFG